MKKLAVTFFLTCLLSLVFSMVAYGAKQASSIIEEPRELGRDKVPVILVYPAKAKNLPLIIGVHGHGGQKEQLVGYAKGLASKGFVVMCVDARGFGDWIARGVYEEYPPISWVATAKDVSACITALESDSKVDANKIGMYGISMGGIITFLEASMDKRIKVAAPIIGSPDWEGLARHMRMNIEYNLTHKWQPSTHPERLLPVALLIQNGGTDDVVPPEGSRDLYNKLKPMYSKLPGALRYIEYRNVGHQVTQEMESEVTRWFVKFLK